LSWLQKQIVLFWLHEISIQYDVSLEWYDPLLLYQQQENKRLNKTKPYLSKL